MDVELLFWDGCPSHPRALSDLRAAMAAAGLDPETVRLTEVADAEQARALRFPGSPTIRIDGRDAVEDPDADVGGLSCRVYRTRDGRVSPVPDPEDLRAALFRAC